jgi:hypothetical protein
MHGVGTSGMLPAGGALLAAFLALRSRGVRRVFGQRRVAVLFAVAWLLGPRARRRWWAAIGTTLRAFLAHLAHRSINSTAMSESRRVTEVVVCPDGEEAVVWWSAPKPSAAADGAQESIWVVLPGGMTSGDTFYVHDAASSGVFGSSRWCVFHNPGIVNLVKGRSPAALTETRYIEHFLCECCARRGMKATLMGFSAGSMLTIATCGRAEANPQLRAALVGGVAIHGPDRIRDVFETHRRWGWGLDRAFALSLQVTMMKNGTQSLGKTTYLKDRPNEHEVPPPPPPAPAHSPSPPPPSSSTSSLPRGLLARLARGLRVDAAHV